MWTCCRIESIDTTWISKPSLRSKASSSAIASRRHLTKTLAHSPPDKCNEDTDRPFRQKSARQSSKKPAKGTDLAAPTKSKRDTNASHSATQINVTSISRQRRTSVSQQTDDGPQPHHETSRIAAPSAPKPPVDFHVLAAAGLAVQQPDELVKALQARCYTSASHPPSHSSAYRRNSHDSIPAKIVHITPVIILATCKELRRRLLLDRSFRLTHIIQIIELLAARCGSCEDAASVAKDLLMRHRGCCQALQAAQRSPEQTELAQLLPRLIPALVSLEFDVKELWESIFRVMHSYVDAYSGNEVAALVPALVELDSVIEADSSSSSSSSTGFGSQQLRQPSMSLRLQVLTRDGGATGDATAGLLLWLVASSLKQVEMDQVVALIRRAMLQGDLSTQGHCYLLRATAWLCERLPGAATEVMMLLQRHESNLMSLLAQRVSDFAEAGRLGPHEFTDAAQSFTQIRFLQPSFVAELAASTTRGIRAGESKLRDISVALYTCAFFGWREAATSDLFVAAAASLESQLASADLKPVALTRLAWSFAVAGGCGLLPQRKADRDLVENFLQKLVTTLQSRVVLDTRRASVEMFGQLRFALQIWSATEPSLVRPELLEAVRLRQQQRKQHRNQQEEQEQQAADKGERQHDQLYQQVQPTAGDSGSSSVNGGAIGLESEAAAAAAAAAGFDGTGRRCTSSGGGSSSTRSRGKAHHGSSMETPAVAVEESAAKAAASGLPSSWVKAKTRTRISELQKDVYRQLVTMGYKPRMEGLVGLWTVDILLTVGGQCVALEVDGPTHFTTSHHRHPLGASLARDTCLRKLGLAVVALSFDDFERVPPAQRGEYLRSRVGRALREATE